MAIRYRANRARSLVIVIVEESVTAHDYAAFVGRLVREPAAAQWRQLVLISERLRSLSPDEVLTLADGIAQVGAATRGPRAIVAFTDLHFGQARALLTRLNQPEDRLALFRDLGDALRWLGYTEGAGRIELQTLLALR